MSVAATGSTTGATTGPAGSTTGPGRLPWRSRMAIGTGRTVAGASKLSGLGTGSVIGGRVSMALDHDLLRRLTAQRTVALVSGTNGKTTTTHLLATALATLGPVASNHLGANMPPGLVAALGADPDARYAALEVDERWLGTVLEQTGPAVVLLLNLSRDQLDRSHEVRKIADRWRSDLERLPLDLVVANADDPLVVWAAGAVDPAQVVWVGTGLGWTLDAAGCPACAGRIIFDAPGDAPGEDPGDDPGGPGGGWHCGTCDFAKPTVSWWLTGADPTAPTTIARAAGDELTPPLALPGRVNLANAAMVLVAASHLGADLNAAAAALGEVETVAGRYRTADIAGATVRMLLAKNPAGWQEAIAMLDPTGTPVVCAINARIADGRDPSWLWDVPYERLRGRFVVATGERRHDLAVRLRYAEVDHDTAADLTGAVRRAAEAAHPSEARPRVDLIANYTAFQDYLDEVGRDG